MSYTNLKDSQLIELICQGKSEVFEEIVSRYQRKIFSYVYRLVSSREDALDIVQEVFIKVYKNIKSFDMQKDFSPWIYRIAHNESVNWLKKNRKFYSESIDDNEMLANTLKSKDDIKQFFEKKEVKIFVRQAVEALPIRYQKIVELKYFQEKSYKEISRILKKPINTVGTMLNRAKKILQKNLKYGFFE